MKYNSSTINAELKVQLRISSYQFHESHLIEYSIMECVDRSMILSPETATTNIYKGGRFGSSTNVNDEKK